MEEVILAGIEVFEISEEEALDRINNSPLTNILEEWNRENKK